MKRLAVVVLGAFVASLLVLVPGINAGADEHDDEFVINPDSGVPGDLIATQVDPDAVQRDCLADPEDLEDFFDEFMDEFPEGFFDFGDGPAPSFGFIMSQVISAIVNDTPAGSGAAFLENLFVLTFIDLATQEPVGENASWNPQTGAGQIEVPEALEPPPYLWVLAAVGVQPTFTDENFAAALEAGGTALAETGDPQAAFGAFIAEFMEPVCQWVQPFEIPRPWPEADPNAEAFCPVLPALSELGEDVTDLLGSIPDDEGMTDEEWVDAIEEWDRTDEMIELFEDAFELLLTGDENLPDTIAPQWQTVTEGLRDAYTALEAIEWDLTGPSGRDIGGALRDGALDDSPNPESDAATEVLTQWFIDNCIPAAPPAETPVEETPRAVPAPAAAAQPTFAG